VSFWTVAMQALMSGYLCGIYLVTAIILGKRYDFGANGRKYSGSFTCNNFYGIRTNDV
jgi:hypothetical protein